MKCKIKDISINYEIKGEGKPVVILHGYSLDHSVMQSCLEPVFKKKNNFKRIYIDLPGMGRSSSAEWIKSSDDMLGIVIDFINKIIPRENFLVIGFSYGGYISRGIIYKLASRVDGLFLLCPVIHAEFSRRNNPEHIVLQKDPQLLSRLDPAEAEFFEEVHVVQNERTWCRFKGEILSSLKLADKDFLSRIKKYGYEFTFDVDKIDKKFNKPALILVGRQDSTAGYKDAWGILENYPRATFAVLDKAGHHLHIEQDKLFNPLVNEWLERVDETKYL